MSMHVKDIATAVQQRFDLELKEFREQYSLIVPAERIIEVCKVLRDEYGFNFLSDETAVDYGPQAEPRFNLVYQMRNLKDLLHISLRVPLYGNAPRLESLEKVFPNANWYEREIWDMFGIAFDNHSDMRRILMPHDWEGHPLRKDYPLGYEEVQFTFNAAEVMLRKPQPKE